MPTIISHRLALPSTVFLVQYGRLDLGTFLGGKRLLKLLAVKCVVRRTWSSHACVAESKAEGAVSAVIVTYTSCMMLKRRDFWLPMGLLVVGHPLTFVVAYARSVGRWRKKGMRCINNHTQSGRWGGRTCPNPI